MKVDHLSFSEAVERLAGQAGITLRYEEGGYNPAHQRGERIRLVEAHKIAAQFYAEQLATGPEAETGRKLPRRARLRPGRRRSTSASATARPGLGPPHPLPARQGLHRQGADPLRPRPGRPPRPHRPLPRPADVADPRHRAARSSASAPASCTRRRQRPEVPQHPRDARSTRSPRCCTASTSPRRTSPRPAAPSSSRATPTSWPATWPGSPPPSPPAARPSAATTSRSSAGC